MTSAFSLILRLIDFNSHKILDRQHLKCGSVVTRSNTNVRRMMEKVEIAFQTAWVGVNRNFTEGSDSFPTQLFAHPPITVYPGQPTLPITFSILDSQARVVSGFNQAIDVKLRIDKLMQLPKIFQIIPENVVCLN